MKEIQLIKPFARVLRLLILVFTVSQGSNSISLGAISLSSLLAINVVNKFPTIFSLDVKHPITGESMHFEAPLPDDFKACIEFAKTYREDKRK